VAKVGTERLHELTSRHCQSSNPDFIDRLIHHGVHPDNRDWYGRTALHYAAENGDTAAAERWIDNGADVNAVDVRESTTALGYAARKGHAEMVRLLLDKGADPAAPADREWARPAVYAELEGNRDVADLLGTA
jgi:ankyrin repeat protein